MVTRKRTNKLEHWEVAMVKAMLAKLTFGNDQDILAYFTRPTRSINHARIADIRNGAKHAKTKPASDDELAHFVDNWPQIDPESGLHVLGDELLIKAREAMLVAVQSYNNPKTYFRSEVFIVTAIIAWTYLLHAYYKSKKLDYRHKRKGPDGTLQVLKTKHGADKHWELAQCLKATKCPLDEGTTNNLNFLIKIRHEIEHQMTRRIDAKLSAKLQACALNFNRTLKSVFGDQFGLDRELSFALQFSGIDKRQKKTLMGQDDLPPHIETMRKTFEGGLTNDQYNDPNYAYRVLFVPKVVNAKTQSDSVIEFVPSGSAEADEINKTYLKEVDKPKYRPGIIVRMMKAEGFTNFNMKNHTDLWQKLGAKNPGKGLELLRKADGWRWYERWVDAVRQHCEENRERYE